MNWIDWTVVILLGIEVVLQLVSVGKGTYSKTAEPSTHVGGAVFYGLLLWYILSRVSGT